MVVRLCCALALHGPENSNKWPLGFFSLESSKVPKGFSSPITTLISLHSRKTNRKKEYDSWIIAVHKRCLKAWSVSSTKRKMSDGELSGNACWQDEVETQLHVRRKGEDVWFVLCSLRMAPRSSSNVIQDESRNTLTRNRSRSLYFSRVIIYVPAMDSHSSSPCTETSHISPKTRWNKAEWPQKGSRLSRFSLFLELWIHHMLCKIILMNLKAEVCLWEALWE